MASFVNLGVHSWHDFMAQAARRVTEPAVTGAESSSTECNRASWAGTDTLEQAVAMAQAGWPDGATAVSKALDSLPAGVEILPDWRMAVQGAFPCIPEYLSGSPECMYRLEDNRRIAHRLSLIVPHAYSAQVRGAQAMQYAKAVAALVRSLEATGIDVAVYSVSTGHNRYIGSAGKRALYAVVVREFGEPVDLAKVAFAFHPAMFRRIGFAWREITPAAADVGQARAGYAATFPVTEAYARELLGEVGELVIMEDLQDLARNNPWLFTDAKLPDLIERLRINIDTAIKALSGVHAS